MKVEISLNELAFCHRMGKEIRADAVRRGQTHAVDGCTKGGGELSHVLGAIGEYLVRRELGEPTTENMFLGGPDNGTDILTAYGAIQVKTTNWGAGRFIMHRKKASGQWIWEELKDIGVLVRPLRTVEYPAVCRQQFYDIAGFITKEEWEAGSYVTNLAGRGDTRVLNGPYKPFEWLLNLSYE